MTCDGIKKFLQLMQVFDGYPGWCRVSQPQTRFREFEVKVCIPISDDPFFAYKIPHSAFFQDRFGQLDRLYFLYIGFLYYFDDMSRKRLTSSLIKIGADFGKFPAYVELGVVHDGIAEDLLNGDDFVFVVQYFVAEPEISRM